MRMGAPANIPFTGNRKGERKSINDPNPSASELTRKSRVDFAPNKRQNRGLYLKKGRKPIKVPLVEWCMGLMRICSSTRGRWLKFRSSGTERWISGRPNQREKVLSSCRWVYGDRFGKARMRGVRGKQRGKWELEKGREWKRRKTKFGASPLL